jgi:hypothetical protein
VRRSQCRGKCERWFYISFCFGWSTRSILIRCFCLYGVAVWYHAPALASGKICMFGLSSLLHLNGNVLPALCMFKQLKNNIHISSQHFSLLNIHLQTLSSKYLPCLLRRCPNSPHHQLRPHANPRHPYLAQLLHRQTPRLHSNNRDVQLPAQLPTRPLHFLSPHTPAFPSTPNKHIRRARRKIRLSPCNSLINAPPTFCFGKGHNVSLGNHDSQVKQRL